MKCNCKNGKTFAFVNRGPDYKKHSQEWIDCDRCGGTGEIPDEMKGWIQKGRELKKLRLKAGFSLMDIKERSPFDMVEFSQAESGRVDPKPYIRKFTGWFWA